MVAKIGQKCYYCYLKVKNAVEVVLPLKQGLKRGTKQFPGTGAYIVEVVLPLKQGLKHLIVRVIKLTPLSLKWFFH